MTEQTVPITPATTTPETVEAPKPRHWDPFDLLTQMQSELDRFWGGRWPGIRPPRRPSEFAEAWTPRADVFSRTA